MEPGQGDDKSHVPAPSLLPVAFAIGLVIVLVGLIISNWLAVGIGAVDRVRVRRRLDPRPVDSRAEGGGAAAAAREAAVGASASAATEARSRRASATRATASSRARRSASAP